MAIVRIEIGCNPMDFTANMDGKSTANLDGFGTGNSMRNR